MHVFHTSSKSNPAPRAAPYHTSRNRYRYRRITQGEHLVCPEVTTHAEPNPHNTLASRLPRSRLQYTGGTRGTKRLGNGYMPECTRVRYARGTRPVGADACAGRGHHTALQHCAMCARVFACTPDARDRRRGCSQGCGFHPHVARCPNRGAQTSTCARARRRRRCASPPTRIRPRPSRRRPRCS